MWPGDEAIAHTKNSSEAPPKAIYFADSAMIVHVVPESADLQKFLHAASGIYRELLYNVYGGAREKDY